MSLRLSFTLLSKLVRRAFTVSRAVKQFTPVSIEIRLIKNPSLVLSLPCVGVSTTISILCSNIKSITVGAS